MQVKAGVFQPVDTKAYIKNAIVMHDQIMKAHSTLVLVKVHAPYGSTELTLSTGIEVFMIGMIVSHKRDLQNYVSIKYFLYTWVYLLVNKELLLLKKMEIRREILSMSAFLSFSIKSNDILEPIG